VIAIARLWCYARIVRKDTDNGKLI
jgi:hypothetical protein